MLRLFSGTVNKNLKTGLTSIFFMESNAFLQCSITCQTAAVIEVDTLNKSCETHEVVNATEVQTTREFLD